MRSKSESITVESTTALKDYNVMLRALLHERSTLHGLHVVTRELRYTPNEQYAPDCVTRQMSNTRSGISMTHIPYS